MYNKCNHPNNAKKRSFLPSSDTCIETGRWVVPIAMSLPTYPLEPHAVLINADAQSVASRIDECMKIRSVQVVFDDEKAQATCTTASFLKYFVTLYRLGAQTGTIVEVQRRKGCSFEFATERRAIIKAARGHKDNTSTQQSKIHLSIPVSSGSSHPNEETLKRILEGLVVQFHHNNEGGRLMCLHHLVSMTNPYISGAQTSSQIAKMILLDSDIGIFDLVGDVLTSPCLGEGRLKMRHCCLGILSNALSALSQNKWTAFDESSQEWFAQSLLPCLIDDIRSCRCLHNAHLSSKCIRLLLGSCPAVRTKATGYELMNVLKNAASFAERNHAKLENEAKFTINALVCN